ncbi:hypothetical protein IPG41_02605 [Candidatus Peregrinibacteria bacterium]|nr:MAG: hypothetical protein IPG41_02605 [Candidatus Peregrinibacteria bacterium]
MNSLDFNQFIETYKLGTHGDLQNRVKNGRRCLTQGGVVPGTQVLDIGCGHDQVLAGEDHKAAFIPRQFEPWDSRLAVWMGAHVTGLDHHNIGPGLHPGPNGGVWTYEKTDISKMDWQRFARQFEIVILNHVVHNTDVHEASTAFSPLVPQEGKPKGVEWIEAYEHYRAELITKVLSTLQPGGRFIFNHFLYRIQIQSGEQSLEPIDETSKKDSSPEMSRYPFQSVSAADQLRQLKDFWRAL